MSQAKDRGRLGHQQWLAFTGIGAGVGWLIGSSASPVLAGVLTSLLGMVVGIVAGLRSVEPKIHADDSGTSAAVDARPLAVLVLALTLAATGGMIVRSHRLLEPEVVREAAWKAASEGQAETVARSDAHSALLFSSSQSECSRLLSLKDNTKAFVGELEHSSSRGARELAARIKDPQTLVTVVEAVCIRE